MRSRLVAGVRSRSPLFSLASAASLASLAGCLANNNGAPSADGGTEPLFDATVYEASPPADAAPAPPDTFVPATDAGSPDAPADVAPLPVTIVITNGVAPVPGIPIVFEDATGAVVSSVATDATGRAAQFLPAGSQVTALLGTPDKPQIVTVLGVEPGDVLSALASTEPANGIGDISVTSLPSAPPSTTVNYQVAAGECGTQGGAPPWAFSVFTGCEVGGTFPLLATAYEENGSPVGFVYQKGNVVPDGGADGGVPTFTLGGTWSTTFGTQTITSANVPPNAAGIAAVSESAGGVVTQTSQYFFGVADDGGAQVSAISVHPGFADFIQSEADINAGPLDDAGNGISVAAFATRSPSATDGGLLFDFAQELPFVTSATLDTTTAGRPTVAWSSAFPLTAADGTLVRLAWTALDPDGGAPVEGTWTVLAPPTATTLQAPALPPTASGGGGEWAPASGATFASPLVVAIEGSFWSGYAQLRAQSAGLTAPNPALDNGYVGGTFVPTLPADGTLKLTAFTVNAD